MIPIKLTLEAFGPFPSKQEIDFSIFDSDGIFLITGKTGSGKTTIFDAIAFGLYGVASGEIRDCDSFKSHFAPQEAVCFVEFCFIVHGKKYTVYREPIQSKLKRNGNYVKESSTAQLTLEDGKIISGITAVDLKIIELLGINADQFKKIVMLPQGEFRKFLSDDSNEKQKTLRKIFSTKLLDDFTEQLRQNAYALKNELSDCHARESAYLESLKISDDNKLSTALSLENRDIPYVLRLLSEHNSNAFSTLSLKKQELFTLKSQKEKINLPYAKEINSKFELLKNAKAKLMLLDEKKQDFCLLSENISTLKAVKEIDALQKIIIELNANKKRTAENIASYKKRTAEAEELYKNALCLVETSRLEQANLALLFTQIEKLKQGLLLLDDICKKEQELSTLQQSEVLLEKKKCILENSLQFLELSAAASDLKKKYDELSALNKEILLCKTLTDEFNSISQSYQQKMNRFIDSQAYFLACKLKENMPCPVCGGLDHPSPASATEHTVSEEQLEQSKLCYDEATRRLKEQQTICKQLLTAASLDVSSHARLSEFLPEIKENALRLKAEINELSAKAELINKNLPSGATKDEIQEQLNRAQTAVAISKQRIEQQITTIAELKQKRLSLAELAEFAEFEASSELTKLTQRISELEQRIEKISKSASFAIQEKDRLLAELNQLSEAVKQQNSQLLQYEEASAIKQAEFDKLLLANAVSFSDYEVKKLEIAKIFEYEASLLEYSNDVAKSSAVIESLSSQLDGLTKMDIEALQEEDFALSAKIDVISNEVEAISIAYGANSDGEKKLSELFKEFEALSTKANEYQRFYDIASGRLSDRINFERYVLASYFADVIENANIRLEEMTNSRYTLNRRTDKEKGNRSSGLSLEVFDAYTGTSRHVNTLSGGESFKISLCLALGLADIISQSSGGIELNTMFIDEGFGSLDSSSLDLAIDCLNKLRATGRYIGIISHVSELQEKIPSKLCVIQEPQGSTIVSLSANG